jgi:hypothetical protein
MDSRYYLLAPLFFLAFVLILSKILMCINPVFGINGVGPWYEEPDQINPLETSTL